MSSSKTSNNKLKGQKCGKITRFFPRVANVEVASCSKSKDFDDENIIEASPDKIPLKALKEVTNTSPPHSTPLCRQEKKRKQNGYYPDDIPELDVELPLRKKPCTAKEGIKVVSLADITKEQFNIYQAELENKTPEKQLQKTPTKRLSSGKKKLYERSPSNKNDFKVEILHNFIKVSPSKSNRKSEWIDTVEKKCTPTKSGEKKQQSILDYISPSSKTSNEARRANERTPVNRSSPLQHNTPNSKVKMKLDFSLSNTLLTKTKKSPPNLDLLFEDSWEDHFEFNDETSLDLSTPQHCVVLEVNYCPTKVVLKVKSSKTEERATCILKSFWMQSIIHVKNTVYLEAYKKDGEWIIDNVHGLLVLEPDYLVSSTSLVGGLFCKRKCVLKHRYGTFDATNKFMLLGTLVHSLVQESLRRKIYTNEAITMLAKQLLTSSKTVLALFESSLSMQEVEEDLLMYVQRVHQFLQNHFANKSGDAMHIDSVHDIEENIWCPEFGIKGKVDVSVKVGNNVLPLEIKTGRASNSVEHRGQVVLYIMMMAKLGYKVNSGLLLYIKDGLLNELKFNANEQNGLIVLRNEIVHYLTASNKSRKLEEKHEEDIEDLLKYDLPAPINHHSACERCEYNLECCSYLQRENYDLSNYQLLGNLLPKLLGHLSSEHIEYFAHWSALLALESNVQEGKPIRDIYTKQPEDREKQGRCLTNMHIHGEVVELNEAYSTTFHKGDHHEEEEAMCNLLASGFAESQFVVVSTRRRPAVASGFVTYINYKSIVVKLDRDLSRRFKNEYILDTYDSNSLTTFNFANLSLLLRNSDRADELRRLIIDKQRPKFKKTVNAQIAKKSISILKNMNKMQQRAIIKAVAAENYLLIKGMPGTGKTATIVSLILLLVEVNCSVIITSHTNSAVDNVCVRLQECGVNVLRLGAENRIHPSLKKCSEYYLTRNCKTPEEFDAVYNTSNVLAVTCLSSKHPIFSKRVMDVCIVDESTQVLQCSVIRALFSAKKFILIGDPDQLPPIVKNKEAMSLGMNESLFERLQYQPDATITLQCNYRMNKTITALANDLTYNGELLIANDGVANANLRIPKVESMSATYKDKQWVLEALSDKLAQAVCIIDTGPVWNMSFANSGTDFNEETSGRKNPMETAVIVTLVKALLKGGVHAGSIGVIAAFRDQVAHIATFLQPLGVDVSTVDQFQGQDREVIIYSCSKSRDTLQPCKINKFSILEDKRRLTVAITRAKHKFIMVADVATVAEYGPFGKLLENINDDQRLGLMTGCQGFNWEKIMADLQ